MSSNKVEIEGVILLNLLITRFGGLKSILLTAMVVEWNLVSSFIGIRSIRWSIVLNVTLIDAGATDVDTIKRRQVCVYISKK